MLKRHYANAILHRILPRFVSQSLMSSSSSSDPFLLRSIGNRLGSGGFVQRLNPIGFHNDRTGLLKVYKGGKHNGLTLISCFDSSHKKADQKARALALHRRFLHGHREERRGGGGTTDLADGRGVGNTTRFHGNDKIVVAVDIDEGMSPSSCSLMMFTALNVLCYLTVKLIFGYSEWMVCVVESGNMFTDSNLHKPYYWIIR